MSTVKRHKHRRPPKQVEMTHIRTGKPKSAHRKIIAGVVIHHQPPAHRREYTLHATKGYRSGQA